MSTLSTLILLKPLIRCSKNWSSLYWWQNLDLDRKLAAGKDTEDSPKRGQLWLVQCRVRCAPRICARPTLPYHRHWWSRWCNRASNYYSWRYKISTDYQFRCRTDMQGCLNSLCDWYDIWGMAYKVDKCKVMQYACWQIQPCPHLRDVRHQLNGNNKQAWYGGHCPAKPTSKQTMRRSS